MLLVIYSPLMGSDKLSGNGLWLPSTFLDPFVCHSIVSAKFTIISRIIRSLLM